MKIGIVTDDRFLEHKTGHTHPEHPNRLKSVYRMLKNDFTDDFVHIAAEPVSLEYLELVHTPVYVQKILNTAEHDFTSLAPDTPASSKTYLAAWLAVGGCLKGLNALIEGRCDVCFSLSRPPGHHALPDRAGGFCILNNLGITARFALNKHGFKRILIIDWDIHHGNGLQQLFYGEKKILYFSSHDCLLYPHTGGWEETGKGNGKGHTVNIPLPREIMDGELVCVYRNILTPLVERYRPDLILVAAGFDAHQNDPVGRSKLTENAFGDLTQLLLDLRQKSGNVPILLALEGGYNPRALAASVKNVFEVLTGKDKTRNSSKEETELSAGLVDRARKIHSAFHIWTD